MHSGNEAIAELTSAADVMLPTISIVVAFTGSERCVIDCLQSISEMGYPSENMEIIAVDDHFSDAISSEIARRYPKVVLLRNQTPLGCNSAKRLGTNASTGDIVAYTDADCRVSPGWAMIIAKNIDAGADAVTGPVRHPKTLLRELVGIADFADYQDDHYHSVNAYVGCNYAIRRELLGTLGLANCHIPFGGDRLESWQLHKAGCNISYDPNMVVYHTPKVNIEGILERRMRYGMKALIMRKIDPTLPGGWLAKLGILAVPAYVCFKLVRDTGVLLGMSAHHHIRLLHAPLLLLLLILFRLLDGAGLLSALYSSKPQKSKSESEN